MRFSIIMGSTLCLAVLAGCRSASISGELPETKFEPIPVATDAAPAGTAGKPEAVPAEGWKLVFEDNFERPDVDENWLDLWGEWEIEDGMLSGRGEIQSDNEFPGNQRLEFDCRADAGACDLTGLLMVGEEGYRSGYFFGFGSENNAYSKLMIGGDEVDLNDNVVITPDKLHHVVCQFEDGTLTHIVDGEIVFEYEDDMPIQGPDNQRFGFYLFRWGHIDNVRFYTKPLENSAE